MFDYEFRLRVHLGLNRWVKDVSDRSAVNLSGSFAEKPGPVEEIANSTLTQILHVLEASKDPVTYFKDKAIINVFLDRVDKLLDSLEKASDVFRDIGIKRPRNQLLEFHLTDRACLANVLFKVVLLRHTLLNPATPVQENAFLLTELQKNHFSLVENRAETLLASLSLEKLNAFKHILSREVIWIQWKSAQCPKFERDPYLELPQAIKTEVEEGEIEEQSFSFENS